MSEIVGACLSQFHDDANTFELLLAFSDGREFGYTVSRQVARRIASEFANEFELANARNAAWDAGYLAGFKASGDGWNGEYPFDGTDPMEDAFWLERRNTYRVLAALKAEGESR